MTTDLEFQDKTYIVAIQLRLLEFYNPKEKEENLRKAYEISKNCSHEEIDNLIRDLDFEISYHRNGNETPETRKDLKELGDLTKNLSLNCL